MLNRSTTSAHPPKRRLGKVKRPGGQFSHDLRLLTEDDDGIWLHGPTGTSWSAPHDRGTLPVAVPVLLAVDRPWIEVDEAVARGHIVAAQATLARTTAEELAARLALPDPLWREGWARLKSYASGARSL